MASLEYRVLQVNTKDFLSKRFPDKEVGAQFDRLGADGWELVHIVPTLTWGTTERYTLFLKRPAPG